MGPFQDASINQQTTNGNSFVGNNNPSIGGTNTSSWYDKFINNFGRFNEQVGNLRSKIDTSFDTEVSVNKNSIIMVVVAFLILILAFKKIK